MHPVRTALCALATLTMAAVSDAVIAQAQTRPPVATAAAELGVSSPPIGWVDFCSRYGGDCAVASLPRARVTLTPHVWWLLARVNRAVNGEIAPVTDTEHWGVTERWDYPSDGRGDCEEYVLEKRRRLMQAGLPRQALLVTVVKDRRGDGHAVLTVKTDHGDFVLDNQETEILPWTATGYRFVKRQAQDNPNRWVAVGEGGNVVSTAR